MLLFIFLKFFHRKSALITYFTGVFNASNLHQIWQNVHELITWHPSTPRYGPHRLIGNTEDVSAAQIGQLRQPW
jgi:hypothetical protein